MMVIMRVITIKMSMMIAPMAMKIMIMIPMITMIVVVMMMIIMRRRRRQ